MGPVLPRRGRRRGREPAEPRALATDFISACFPDETGTLAGDKATSVVFDNAKIKRFVPEFVATTRFHEGIARTLAWFDADPARKVIDNEANRRWDRILRAYGCGLDAAFREFGPSIPQP